MRFLLVFLVLALLAWRWRSGRSKLSGDDQHKAPGAAVEVLACSHCGVHLPATEAIKGTQGVYCCSAHRQLAESP